MSGSVKVQVNLFGAFRAYSSNPVLELVLPAGASLAEVKQSIKSMLASNPAFDKASLVDESALADEVEVLQEDAILMRDVSLAILPPVCGG